jgi:uncharacterized protein (DUF3820 family)
LNLCGRAFPHGFPGYSAWCTSKQRLAKRKRETEKTLMTFGKYRGSPVSDVPLNYLQWVRENMLDNASVQKMVTEELSSRDKKALK